MKICSSKNCFHICRTKLLNNIVYLMQNRTGNKKTDTKQVILEAAEAEFLEKGYGNAKMMAIAKRANVSHSMLHYYFSSKENLFQKIFQQKVQILSQMFEGVGAQRLSFLESISIFIQLQFDFVMQNPCLPLFIINEVNSERKSLRLVIEAVKPQMSAIFEELQKKMSEEVEKGSIRPINFLHLIVNILSMNISTFLVLSLIKGNNAFFDPKMKESILDERRESNVQFVLNALKP